MMLTDLPIVAQALSTLWLVWSTKACPRFGEWLRHLANFFKHPQRMRAP